MLFHYTFDYSAIRELIKKKMKVWILSRLFVDPLKEGDLAEPCVGVLLLGPPGAGVLPGSKEYWVYYGMLHLEVKSTS